MIELPIYRPDVTLITRGLAAHYDFKTCAGLSGLPDLSSLMRNGTLVNGPAWSNGGLDFSAVSTQYVTASGGAPSATAYHAFGVCRIDDASAIRTPVGRWGSPGDWIFQSDTSRHLYMAMNGFSTVTTGNTFSTGVWFFFEGYNSGSQAGIRLNASGSYATASGTYTGTAGTFAIGRNNDGAQQYIEGAMGYYLEYTRALAADEVAHTYTVLRRIMSVRGVALP